MEIVWSGPSANNEDFQNPIDEMVELEWAPFGGLGVYTIGKPGGEGVRSGQAMSLDDTEKREP